MSVEGNKKIIFAFSFEKILMEYLCLKYTAELSILESEKSEYLGQTAADILNITIGNILSQLAENGYSNNISVPQIIDSEEFKNTYKNDLQCCSLLETNKGKMVIGIFQK
jgi:hypothetical protein